MDYKEWIQNKAEELAQEQYDTEYYDLNDYQMAALYHQAEEAHKDYTAAMMDAACEAELDRRLGL
ncbi:hypothetical protein LCGC14_1868860 [marine sediment metagenome]|uniref:Uncharacterized protein n=1 Tax=marine sediment metagenome TaxID=412755 RepID=A0A0F9J4B5_9ZZZZ